jgi:hypothetical protein
VCGWWWLAGGVWHYYPAPIYPYPPVVSTQVYVEPVVVAPPPVVMVPAPAAPVLVPAPAPVVIPAPAPAAPPTPPSAAAQMRYYCDNPPGYYPQVPVCNGQFRPVSP